jgi:hypothetical protein
MKDFSFDYIYYRLVSFYFKWDGRNGITAVIGVSMIQVLTVIDIVLFFTRLNFSRSELAPYSKTIGYAGLGITFLVIVINYFRYRNKYNSFKKKWKHESKSERRRKGVLVIICLVLPLLLLVIMGIL